MTRRGVLVALCGLAFASVRASQIPAPQAFTGLIVGHVIDGDSNAPVTGVIVNLSPLSGGASTIDWTKVAQRVAVDANGAFVFAGLPHGQYDIAAVKPGYVTGQYGKRLPLSASGRFELGEGQRVSDMTIRVWRYASIAGTVLDEANEPVVGITVQVRRRLFLGGYQRWYGFGSDGRAVTDDRGMFRFPPLSPGEYIVFVTSTQTTLPGVVLEESRHSPAAKAELQAAISAAGLPFSTPGSRDHLQVGTFVLQGNSRSIVGPPPDDSTPAVYRTTFYPDALAAADADVISLRSGESRSGIDLHLRPVPTVRVTGTLTGPAGPVPLAAVRLTPPGTDQLAGGSSDFNTAVALSDARGAFTFLGVPAGQYVVSVLTRPLFDASTPGTPVPATPVLWGSETISVETRDVEVPLPLREGFRVTGRFEFEGQTPRPEPERLQQIVVLCDTPDFSVGTTQGHGDAAGRFSTAGTIPGRYVISVNSVPGWRVKSVMINGRDVTTQPFELRSSDITGVVITFTDQPWAEVRGTVRNARGTPDDEFSVVAFPTDPKRWIDYGLTQTRIRSTRPSSAGSYTLTNLPPGEYFVAAISQEAIGLGPLGWDPKYFETVSRVATRVRVTLGQTVSQDLRAAEIK